MEQLVSNPAFQAYAASAIALGFNLLVLANNTALTRAKAGEAVNPEDKEKINQKATVVFEEGNDKTARYKRAHRNALENIPLFLITGFLLSVVGVGATAAYALFGIFAVSRIMHSICYVGGIQPWRTVFFVIGALTQAVVLGFIGYHVFV